MNTELYIEGYRLDITKEISALLNFAIDDIKDFSARSTTWSRTIVLPGTSNNNKLFGHIFQVGQGNVYNGSLPNVGTNFNAAASAPVILFQDQIQTFKGVLRLLQININDGFQGACEYEVSIFGNLVGLNATLSGQLLESLDFSAYDHVYNDANIVSSWDNPGGSGVYYPLIDYGTYSTLKHDWDIKTFRPALYAREYIDKMITAAGYRWQAPLFDSPRFKGQVVPHNKRKLTTNVSTLIDASNAGPQVVDDFPGSISADVVFDVITGTGFIPDVTDTIFTYNGTIEQTIPLAFSIAGQSGNGVTLTIYKNSFTGSVLYSSSQGPGDFSFSSTINFSIAPGDTIQFTLTGVNSGWTVVSAQFSVTTSALTPVEINIGNPVVINDTIPQNIRQIDFLVGIVKLYNLYVYEDKFDERLIYITPYIDFYSKNTSNAVDWTHKLNRNKVVKVKPMSELNAKVYKFKYKSDSDYWNDLYRKRYNEGYGDRVYDSEFEFTTQVKEFEIVFSATPLIGYGGEQKVYPTIFKQSNNAEENIDSNIRILQTKKITGVASWDIKNGATVLSTLTRYGYAGHLDDPTTPTNDLNFGAPRELFFILSAGSLSSNQFNVYWSNYMAEITNKDSKLVTANFYLTAKDILSLDFSKYVYVDGIAFRLNAIRDYDATNPNDCVVELLKVNTPSYSEAPGNDGPPEGCYLLWSDDNTLDWDDADELLYGDCNTNPGDGEPPDPGTIFYLNWSFTKVLAGTFRIFVNDVLLVNTTQKNASAVLDINDGDEVRVNISGLIGRPKRILVTNDVDGVMNDTTVTTGSQDYVFTVDVNKNYTAQGVIT